MVVLETTGRRTGLTHRVPLRSVRAAATLRGGPLNVARLRVLGDAA